MTRTCKNCGREYEYDDDDKTGYCADLCGPFCDGQWSAKQQIERQAREIASLLVKIASLDEKGGAQ
jgi:hypothetical protein